MKEGLNQTSQLSVSLILWMKRSRRIIIKAIEPLCVEA